MPITKVLLIDDDEDDYILTRDLLNQGPAKDNYQLSWCNNYIEAIGLMLRNLYDVFLVDYRLGKFSGLDLLDEAVKSNCNKPIIILTGKGDAKIDQEAMHLGAADYLVKDEVNSRILERTLRYSVRNFKTLERLKTSETQFRIIFERSKDPMAITNIEGRILEANNAALEFFGLTKEALLFANASEFYKDRSTRAQYIVAMESKGSVTDMECEFVTKNGVVKVGSISSFQQFSDNDSEKLYYTIIHDLTPHKDKEHQLDLEKKLSAIERTAKNFAVEIYNPLSNINLAVDDLRIDSSRQEDLIVLDIVKKNCEKINRLTAELIASTGTSGIKMKKTDFNKLVTTSVLEAESLYNLEIQTHIEGNVWLNGDKEKLAFVLQNIFQNAADAIHPDAEKREVVVEVKKASEAITLEVKDNGSGIPEDDLEKIFEPFFTTKPKASGLGLTHSQRIIQAHNGTLKVTSNENKGTTVVITLPVE